MDIPQGDTILESNPGSPQGHGQQQGPTRARPNQGPGERVTVERPQLGRALGLRVGTTAWLLRWETRLLTASNMESQTQAFP